jgi:hypothetical protein
MEQVVQEQVLLLLQVREQVLPQPQALLLVLLLVREQVLEQQVLASYLPIDLQI